MESTHGGTQDCGALCMGDAPKRNEIGKKKRGKRKRKEERKEGTRTRSGISKEEEERGKRTVWGKKAPGSTNPSQPPRDVPNPAREGS